MNLTKHTLINLSLVFASLIISLVLAEIALRLAMPEKADHFYSLNDELLLYRYLPGGDIDQNGFRNKEILSQYDIIAIGDSQTLGDQAAREEAWPQRLADFSGLKVYNMAVGGYGPLQYLYLTKNQAFNYKPKLVIWGLYLGNDLFDVHYLAYEKDPDNNWLEFKDERHQQKLAELDWPSLEDYFFQEVLPQFKAERQAEIKSSLIGKLRSYLRQKVKLYALLGNATRGLRERLGLATPIKEAIYQSDLSWARENPDKGLSYENGDISTIFTPAYRSAALNLDDLRISESLKISLGIFKEVRDYLEPEGAEFVLAIIPTKESAYRAQIETDNQSYKQLIAYENEVRKQILEYCLIEGINCYNLLPDLQSALSRGEALYPRHHDGHPLAKGYEVIAQNLFNYLQSNKIID